MKFITTILMVRRYHKHEQKSSTQEFPDIGSCVPSARHSQGSQFWPHPDRPVCHSCWRSVGRCWMSGHSGWGTGSGCEGTAVPGTPHKVSRSLCAQEFDSNAPDTEGEIWEEVPLPSWETAYLMHANQLNDVRMTQLAQTEPMTSQAVKNEAWGKHIRAENNPPTSRTPPQNWRWSLLGGDWSKNRMQFSSRALESIKAQLGHFPISART